MENVLFPMKNVSISRRAFVQGTSHANIIRFGGGGKKPNLNYINIRTRSIGGSDASCWIFTKIFNDKHEIILNTTAYKVYIEAIYENEYIKLDYNTKWYLYAKKDLIFFNGDLQDNTYTKYSAGQFITTWTYDRGVNYYMIEITD